MIDDFRDKLTVQTSTSTVNGSNEPVESWSTFCEPWGQIEAKTGDEHSLETAQRTQAEVEYTVAVRSDPETRLITPSMRILWDAPGGTITLAVSAVLKSQKRDVIHLLTQQRTL